MHSKPNIKTLIFAKESLFMRQLNEQTGEQQEKILHLPFQRQQTRDIYGIKKQGGLRGGGRMIQ